MRAQRNKESIEYLTLTSSSLVTELKTALTLGRFYYQSTIKLIIIVQAEGYVKRRRKSGVKPLPTYEWFYAYASRGKTSYQMYVGQRSVITLNSLDQTANEIAGKIGFKTFLAG